MNQATPAIAPTLSSEHAECLPMSTAVDVSRTMGPVHASFQGSEADLELVTYLSFQTSDGQVQYQTCDSLLLERPEWREAEFRHAYAEAAVEQGIAWQVRVNRERRGMTQGQLAAAIGTRQSAISRMEDPEYGAHSLTQLQKVAKVFDCALLVKLASFSTLALESKFLSEHDLFVKSYEGEMLED